MLSEQFSVSKCLVSFRTTSVRQTLSSFFRSFICACLSCVDPSIFYQSKKLPRRLVLNLASRSGKVRRMKKSPSKRPWNAVQWVSLPDSRWFRDFRWLSYSMWPDKVAPSINYIEWRQIGSNLSILLARERFLQKIFREDLRKNEGKFSEPKILQCILLWRRLCEKKLANRIGQSHFLCFLTL